MDTIWNCSMFHASCPFGHRISLPLSIFIFHATYSTSRLSASPALWSSFEYAIQELTLVCPQPQHPLTFSHSLFEAAACDTSHFPEHGGWRQLYKYVHRCRGRLFKMLPQTVSVGLFVRLCQFPLEMEHFFFRCSCCYDDGWIFMFVAVVLWIWN